MTNFKPLSKGDFDPKCQPIWPCSLVNNTIKAGGSTAICKMSEWTGWIPLRLLRIKSSKEFWTPHTKRQWMLSGPSEYNILDLHLGCIDHFTQRIKINFYISGSIYSKYTMHINNLSFLVSIARLGEAIKCYSFQSWPLEPILRDPLCIMKMVHTMLTKKKQICIFQMFFLPTSSHVITVVHK